MQKHLLSALCLWAAATAGTAHTRTFTIDVQNPSAHERKSQPVVLPLAACADFVVTRATVRGEAGEIASQIDDLDGDLRPDELAFVTDLPAGGTRSFAITLSDEGTQTAYERQTRAYIKLNDIKEKHPQVQSVRYPGDADLLDMYNSLYGHGAVFENGYMAYRIYMDHRQSIDLYGKTTPRLEMDTTGFYTTERQLSQGYGCDILWAGQSVGAGSFRGWRDGAPCYIDSVAWRQQSIVADGPVRTIVEVTDKHWTCNGQVQDMTQRYTLYAGRRDLSVDIRIDGNPGEAVYCTGILKLEEQPEGFFRAEDGLSGSWGFNVPEKSAPDHREGVGLGLYVETPFRKTMMEDSLNYLTLLRTDATGHLRYTIAACAERENGGFKTAAQWFDYLEQWREELSRPVILSTIHAL